MATNLAGMFGQTTQQNPLAFKSNAPTYSGALDYNTFKQYLTPALYGDPSFNPENRDQWTKQLGLDIGGAPQISIAGLSPAQFAKPVGSDQFGGERAQARTQNYQDVFNSPEWRAAVDKAMADPNTIYQIAGDRINADGSTTGGRTHTTTQYKVQDGKLVPIGAKEWEQESTWNDFRDNGLPMFAAVLGGGLAYNALGAAGASSAGGLSGMDLAADAVLGAGNNITTAGSMFDAAGGLAGTGIPQFAQQPGYGQQVGGALADASGSSPMTGAVNSAATNPALIDSALQTPGYGVSSAGIGGGPGTGLAGVIGDAVNGLKQIPGVSKVGGNIVSNLLGSVLGGGSGGVSTLGNLGSLFTNYNQYSNNKDLINEIKGIYSPDGAYAKTLGEQLARKDAAAGRNSQYGPRLADLMGRLGDSQARALSGLGGFMQSQQGGLNGMVGAGSRLFDSMGGMNALAKLFQGSGEQLTNDWALGPNGGPQMPLEDPDNWDLFGG